MWLDDLGIVAHGIVTHGSIANGSITLVIVAHDIIAFADAITHNIADSISHFTAGDISLLFADGIYHVIADDNVHPTSSLMGSPTVSTDGLTFATVLQTHGTDGRATFVAPNGITMVLTRMPYLLAAA